MDQKSIWADIWVTASPPHFHTDSLISLITYLNSFPPSRLFIRLRSKEPLSLELLLKLIGRGYEAFRFWLVKERELMILPELEGHNPFLVSPDPGLVVSHNPSEDKAFINAINAQRTKEGNKPPFSLVSPPSPLPGSGEHLLTSTSAKYPPKFKVSCVGGTFDHLHDGHRLLLTASALSGGTLIQVGVSGDPLLTNKKMAQHLEPFPSRKEKVEEVLGFLTSAPLDVFLLEEAYGPTITNPEMDVILLSEETKGAISSINQKRKEASLSPIQSVVVGYLLDVELVPDYEKRLREGTLDEVSNETTRISSTSIRRRLESKKEAKI